MLPSSPGIQRESHLDGRGGTTQAHGRGEKYRLVEGDPSKITKLGKELQYSFKGADEIFEKESRCLCMEP